MKTAFVICSRLESSRVPRKALKLINGRTTLDHLFARLRETNIPIILAVPDNDQAKQYMDEIQDASGVNMVIGYPDCPLARTAHAAELYEVENVIRVCHDKIFVDPANVLHMLDVFLKKALDYAYSSSFIDGTAFEIISNRSLQAAASAFRNVEYIGYAVRSVTENVMDVPMHDPCDARLLLDYPEDVTFLETVMAACGNDCSLNDVMLFLSRNKWANMINRLPRVTVYTCAYNAQKWIERAMGSVAKQHFFREMEYIVVDDHSTDDTPLLASRFCAHFRNARFIRNDSNLGLASSSNVALKAARGRYIVRLDADDYFMASDAVQQLVDEIESTGKDVIIPNNYFGSMAKIQHGKDAMHVGGSIFKTRAVNHVKFTEGLRGYEGLDFFERARGQLDIGYLNKPIFFYTQRPDSMSKTNLKEREAIRSAITGGPLITKQDLDDIEGHPV